MLDAVTLDQLRAFMAVVERAGTSFAFPTRTVHMVQELPEGARGNGARTSTGAGHESQIAQ